MKIPFDTIVPGHGDVESGDAARKRYLTTAAYLRDLWAQTAELKKQRLTPLQTAQKLDLSKYLPDTNVSYQGVKNPAATNSTNPRAVERMYYGDGWQAGGDVPVRVPGARRAESMNPAARRFTCAGDAQERERPRALADLRQRAQGRLVTLP